jgi:hypothetical protein
MDQVVTHDVRLFVGSLPPLRAIQALAPMARIFALSPAATLWVLPLDDDVHDALHRHSGTGEWLPGATRLTKTDLVSVARLTKGCEVAYIETAYVGRSGTQSAVVWRDGAVVMQPVALDATVSRPPQFWPINGALRALGVQAHPPDDEFTTLGLMGYRSHAMIAAHATEIGRDL